MSERSRRLKLWGAPFYNTSLSLRHTFLRLSRAGLPYRFSEWFCIRRKRSPMRSKVQFLKLIVLSWLCAVHIPRNEFNYFWLHQIRRRVKDVERACDTLSLSKMRNVGRKHLSMFKKEWEKIECMLIWCPFIGATQKLHHHHSQLHPSTTLRTHRHLLEQRCKLNSILLITLHRTWMQIQFVTRTKRRRDWQKFTARS